jgi:hypothetical protein
VSRHIEMATKIRYEALTAEGQYEQFDALNCAAPIGVWQFPSAVRHRLDSLLMWAAQRFLGVYTVTRRPRNLSRSLNGAPWLPEIFDR